MTSIEMAMQDSTKIKELFIRAVEYQLSIKNMTTVEWLARIKDLHKLKSDSGIPDICNYFPICAMARSLRALSENIKFISGIDNNLQFTCLEELELKLATRGF